MNNEKNDETKNDEFAKEKEKAAEVKEKPEEKNDGCCGSCS